MTRLVNLIDAAKHYRGEVHQNDAWLALDNTLTQAQRELFTRLYRRSQVRPRSNTKDQSLDVEYFYQRDSLTGHGERSCQSSAIAMAVDYMSPGFIYDDDEYLNIVLNFGDTVSQLAHKAALDSIGIKNQFVTPPDMLCPMSRCKSRALPTTFKPIHKTVYRQVRRH